MFTKTSHTQFNYECSLRELAPTSVEIYTIAANDVMKALWDGRMN